VFKFVFCVVSLFEKKLLFSFFIKILLLSKSFKKLKKSSKAKIKSYILFLLFLLSLIYLAYKNKVKNNKIYINKFPRLKIKLTIIIIKIILFSIGICIK
jgi:hypothetical protein